MLVNIDDLLRRPSKVESDVYYRQLTHNVPIEVRFEAGEKKGKGVFATRDITKGEVVFVEDPYVSMQCHSSYVKTLNCSSCFNYIGDLEGQIRWNFSHAMRQEKTEFWFDEAETQFLRSIASLCPDKEGVACQNGCGALYCSGKCRDRDWGSHHWLLCPVSGDDRVEWFDEFYKHARRTNDVFILAAQAFAKVIGELERMVSACSMEDGVKRAWEPVLMGHKGAWWDCVALPEDVAQGEEKAFRSDLKELASDSLTLFLHALEEKDKAIYDKYSPVVSISEEEERKLDDILANIVRKYNTTDEEIDIDVIGWEVEGNGFFRLHSCINHSCAPNCRASLPEGIDDGSKAIIEATEDIPAGTEITVSYVDDSLELDERQHELRDYGFTCHCERCEAEKICFETA